MEYFQQKMLYTYVFSIFLDDEPADGPSCYFLLTGFTCAKFFQELSSVKLKAHALVKVVGHGICASQGTCMYIYVHMSAIILEQADFFFFCKSHHNQSFKYCW